MSRGWLVSLPGLVLALAATNCAEREGPYVRPDQISDFGKLFEENCAGCHGHDGQHGGAPALHNAIYQAWAPKDRMTLTISRGRPGTPMPAWAVSEGGSLTEKQIQILVDGMKAEWKGDAPQNLPPYLSEPEGDSKRGAAAFGMYCAQCHGADGRGGQKGGSVVDPAFLELVTDQRLRITVVVGCAGGTTPNFTARVPGHPMQPQEISDVVAWVASHRQ